MERPRALRHRLVEQVLLRGDVRGERALLDAKRLRDLADRGAVVALLREQPRGFPRQLVSPARHGGTLTTVRYGTARARIPRVRAVRWPGRGRRLDAGRVPRAAAEVHRDARQLRADGRPARARVDPARADAAAEAGPDREGAGRGRPRAADLPRRRGPRQDA